MIMPRNFEMEEEIKGPLIVLQDLVIEHLEKGKKGSKFPHFHNYIDFLGDDLEPRKIAPLREEIVQIQLAFTSTFPAPNRKIVVSVPVHATGYSPLFGLDVEKDSEEVILDILNNAVEMCQIALFANCGFGRFTIPPEKILEVEGQLRENPETICVPFTGGSLETKIFAYDSNNNLKQGRAADGLWVPFQVVGLLQVRLSSRGTAVSNWGNAAFLTTREIKTHHWIFDHFGNKPLFDVAERSTLFGNAYQKLTGESFDKTKVLLVEPQWLEFLQQSCYFRQNLNRICNRWIL